MRYSVLLASALLVAGCGYNEIPLSAPVSEPPVPPGGEAPLYAGFGRADITPPPGPGLYAYGPEGREARGYRNRLYAKALVLEDAEGERIALVVADLGVISVALHRSAADRIVESTGIGADRLVLAATHTHAGPGNFMGVKQFDDHGTSVAGFDTAMVGFLAERIGNAVRQAVDSLRPARVGFAMVPVWGYTRNRSLGAFRNNPDSLKVYEPPPGLGLDESQRAVDPTWTMLRVDLFDAGTARFVPAGALSIFAIHGNAIPSVNDLYDADIHAVIQRRLGPPRGKRRRRRRGAHLPRGVAMPAAEAAPGAPAGRAAHPTSGGGVASGSRRSCRCLHGGGHDLCRLCRSGARRTCGRDLRFARWTPRWRRADRPRISHRAPSRGGRPTRSLRCTEGRYRDARR